jgi:hypothetical protein
MRCHTKRPSSQQWRLVRGNFATMLDRAIRNSGQEREVKQIEAKVASDGQGE